MGPGLNSAHEFTLWCGTALPLVADTSDPTHNHQTKAHQ